MIVFLAGAECADCGEEIKDGERVIVSTVTGGYYKATEGTVELDGKDIENEIRHKQCWMKKQVENNAVNRAKLAQTVVEEADYDALWEMAINACIELYERDEGKFQEDWEAAFGDKDEQLPEKPCDDGSIAK
jgi:hypothetical protein